MTSLQWRRQDWAIAGYFRPHGPSAKVFSSSCPAAAILGPVDLLQRRRDSLAVFVGNEVQRIADQVNDAGLNLGLRKHRGDCVRKASDAARAALSMALTILPEPTMTDPYRCANPRTDRIRTLNDAFRTSLSGGKVMLTRAVAALGADIQREIFAALRRYDDFDADNDSYGEHDFGMMTIRGDEILFKIDYYDQDLALHSTDPSDPAVTHRVLTVMLSAKANCAN